MKNTKAAGNVRAKTGFIGNVRSLSGYAYTGDNEPVKLAENIQDLVCIRLANYKRK
jgi:D-alanyl-D-alanine carboxypeptidase